MAKPELGLRIGLFYRTAIKARMEDNKVDSGLAMGIGRVDFLPENRISEGDGEAFRLSGQLIETLPPQTRMGFGLLKRIKTCPAERYR